ncbi:MAG: hypothetical protein COY98_03665 [Candidatus Yonathbacteria bacterium CG_4_10_14_0_8_um_filter_43_17]|uniref:Uncharacterized protein n=1 Tax=Candidatus Yonathbacteria bacterium CG_4_10_14_0_8_um_filter_43_17 TaxID=1975099 RepID=A0A2M7Q4I2_9BACT|nr:MAG: hypothetical protein COY98_03665 [Candidatus Yonathbacteria bacterium CG_4_10_14_0_8_um_filter_43_17]
MQYYEKELVMKKILMLLSIITVFALTACGSSGESTPPSATYTITATAGADGTVSPLGVTNVTQGNSQGYTMAPSSGFHVATLSIDGASISPVNAYTFTNVQANHTISATFSLIPPPQTYSISGSVTGGVQSGVTVSVSPGSTETNTLADGSYMFSGLSNGSYTVTASHPDNPTFSPSESITVTVNGANVTGVNFTTPVPVLAVGKLLYPCSMAICTKDLSSGVESVVYGAYNSYPDTIVPYRTWNNVAFIGSNINGVVGMSLSTLASIGRINANYLLASYCSAWPADHPAVSFDISPLGDFAVMASNCTPLGSTARKDIFLVKMDGSAMWVRVTDDVASDSQPVIGGVNLTTGYVTVLFVRDGTEILQQIVDPALDLLVGVQTVVASNVMGGVRAMSVNSTYTHLAFMKNVGGVSHITVAPLAGGQEINLGAGTDPYWSLDGSNLIMYTNAGALWAMNPDGTGKMSVPVPSNLQYGLGKVVFGPAGY